MDTLRVLQYIEQESQLLALQAALLPLTQKWVAAIWSPLLIFQDFLPQMRKIPNTNQSL